MTRLSQTMRIDIPPDLKEELRLIDKKRGTIPMAEPPPNIPVSPGSASSLGDTDFQQLFQSVYDGAIITTLTGQIVDANTRALYFLQYTRDTITALNLTDIISGSSADTVATLQSGIEKDRFILIQAYCARHDTSLFPCEIAVNCLKIRDKQYLCCFIRDISWRRQAEEMLRTVHTAIQHSATGIAIADLSGQIDYINMAGAHLWGQTTMEALIGMKLGDLITDQESVAAMVYAVKRGESWHSELTLTTESHVMVHVQMAVAPFPPAPDYSPAPKQSIRMPPQAHVRSCGDRYSQRIRYRVPRGSGRSDAARRASTSPGSRWGEATSRILPFRHARLAIPRAASPRPKLVK